MERAVAVVGVLLAVGVAHAPSVRAQVVEPKFIVVTETHSLDAASSGDDGPGTIDGTHVMRYVAPSPGTLSSMRVGEQFIVKLHDISGASNVRAMTAYYDGRTETSPKCPTTYVADLRVDKGGGPGLFIKRTAAGFELATYPYAEFWVNPFEACAGVAHGSCEFVFNTPMVFKVSVEDVEKLDRVRATYQGKGDWNEGEARMCHGTVTATLSGDLVPDEEIAVEGPTCACDGNPRTFTAKTKTGGGAFEKWDVKATGGEPHVVENSGGATAKLTLYGVGKLTGATAVTAVYRKHGKEFRSEPKTIHFCQVEKPELQAGSSGRNRKDFQYDATRQGTVEIAVEGKAWLDGEEASEKLLWEGAAHDSRPLVPNKVQAKRVKLEGKELPQTNDGFGPARIVSRFVETECTCGSEAVEARLFFARDATNNPGGVLPNWAFYWRLTAAGRDGSGSQIPFKVVKLMPATAGAGGNPNTVSRFDPYADVIYVGEHLLGAGTTFTGFSSGCCARRDGSVSTGIDCFGEALRHELAHRTELYGWWGLGMARYPSLCSSSPICLVDKNLDWVPDEENCGGRRQDAAACAALPTWCGSVNDLEMHAYDEGWRWPRGSAKDEDWAAPGSQWPDGN
jgi:hypothetical protein